MQGTQIKVTFQSENTSFETNGLYYRKGDATYICYDEEQDMGKIKTIVKIKDSEVLITRKGSVSMRQNFIKNKKTTGTLNSPYGTFQMETQTKNLVYSHGKLYIAYILRLNGDDTGQHTITINFKEDEE